MKLVWHEPRWSYAPRMWQSLRSILNLASLLRIAVLTVVVSIAILAGFRWAFPLMVFPNLWPLLLKLPALFLVLLLQLAVLTYFQPRVTVSKSKIILQHGQTAFQIDPRTVTATYLSFHSENRIRLRICYVRKTKRKSRTIGIPPAVNFTKLAELLPIEPVIHDARNR
jgi:hypothetical protein